jgi:hypothetical protein
MNPTPFERSQRYAATTSVWLIAYLDTQITADADGKNKPLTEEQLNQMLEFCASGVVVVGEA